MNVLCMFLSLLCLLATSNASFSPVPSFGVHRGGGSGSAETNNGSTSTAQPMQEIAMGVVFDTIAREWRCKWSLEGDKASLVAAQVALDSVLEDVKNVDGVKRVDRVVCGGCLDFKVIISLSADKFDAWEEDGFEPEEVFLDMLKGIDGISLVETQTYTIMAV